MLREVLNQMDQNFLISQAAQLRAEKFLEDVKTFVTERSPAFRNFIDSALAAYGAGATEGALVVLALLINFEHERMHSDQWIENMLSEINDDFCSKSAKMLRFGDALYVQAKEIINDSTKPFKIFLNTMTLRFSRGKGFQIGVLTTIELLRQYEEGSRIRPVGTIH
jgi:hypothetical protein